MKNSKKEWLIDQIDFDYILQNKMVKIILYSGIGLAMIYSLGHIFKISAQAVRGYKDFRSAIKN